MKDNFMGDISASIIPLYSVEIGEMLNIQGEIEKNEFVLYGNQIAQIQVTPVEYKNVLNNIVNLSDSNIKNLDL